MHQNNSGKKDKATVPSLVSSILSADPAELKSVLLELERDEKIRAQTRKCLPQKIPVDKEIERFLNLHANPNTRSAYKLALDRLIRYCKLKHSSPVIFDQNDASAFLISLRQESTSESSIEAIAKRLSAWYSWMLSEHPEMAANPFLRNRSRLSPGPIQKCIPTKVEVSKIIASLSPKNAAALEVIASHGIAADDLGAIVLDGNHFVIEGKKQAGILSPIAMQRIKRAKLAPVRPFATRSPRAWSKLIWWHVRALAETGRVGHSYSAADFRSFYVVETYKKHQDIAQLRDLLGLADLRSTVRLLKSLGLEIPSPNLL